MEARGVRLYARKRPGILHKGIAYEMQKMRKRSGPRPDLLSILRRPA